jgi:chitinase
MTAIALNHGLSLDALKRANPQITNPDLIFLGQTINIPR